MSLRPGLVASSFRWRKRNGAVASAVFGAPSRGTAPLRLALAGATRSGSAGVGDRLRSGHEATLRPIRVNRNKDYFWANRHDHPGGRSV